MSVDIDALAVLHHAVEKQRESFNSSDPWTESKGSFVEVSFRGAAAEFVRALYEAAPALLAELRQHREDAEVEESALSIYKRGTDAERIRMQEEATRLRAFVAEACKWFAHDGQTTKDDLPCTPQCYRCAIDKEINVIREDEGRVNHTCHWPGCRRAVPPKMWGCYAHWIMLPPSLRAEIGRTYRPGQELDKSPSAKYVKAARAVQDWISLIQKSQSLASPSEEAATGSTE